MKPEYSTSSDFISDPSFHNFVLNADANDQVFWENWIKNHPEKIREVQQAMEFIRSQYAEKTEPDSEELATELHRFKQYLHEHPATQFELNGKQRSIPRAHQSGLWWRIAAAVAILLIASFFGYQKIMKDAAEEALSQRKPVYIEKVNPKGQKTLFMLPDGSTVKLNAESKLVYPDTFATDIREVTLVGEAFFDVKENPAKPFIVKTAHLQTRVLGTSFNIKAYPDENSHEVALVTGKVQINDNTDPSTEMILSPNELAIYNNVQKNINKTKFNPATKLAWRDNTIYFDNSNFAEIIKTLERWYGVNFILPQDMEIQDKFTGVYRDKSLEQVLDGISFSLDFQFKIDNKIVFIKK